MCASVMSGKSTLTVIYNDLEDSCSQCSGDGDREECSHALLHARERNEGDVSMSDTSIHIDTGECITKGNQRKGNWTKINQAKVGKKCIGSVALLCIVTSLVIVVVSFKNNASSDASPNGDNAIIKGSEYYIGNKISDIQEINYMLPTSNIAPEDIITSLVNTSNIIISASTSGLSEKYEGTSMPPASTGDNIPLPNISSSSELILNSTSTSIPSTSTSEQEVTLMPSVSTNSSSEIYEGTSIPLVSTSSTIQSTSISGMSEISKETSIPSVSTLRSINDIPKEEMDKKFKESLENLKLLSCEPKPFKESVKKYLGSKNTLHNSEQLYPDVVAVMRCDSNNSFCGSSLGQEHSSKGCNSTQTETKTYAVRYQNKNNYKLVYHIIEVIDDVKCECI